jgi:hypothetical protein
MDFSDQLIGRRRENSECLLLLSGRSMDAAPDAGKGKGFLCLEENPVGG